MSRHQILATEEHPIRQLPMSIQGSSGRHVVTYSGMKFRPGKLLEWTGIALNMERTPEERAHARRMALEIMEGKSVPYPD